MRLTEIRDIVRLTEKYIPPNSSNLRDFAPWKKGSKISKLNSILSGTSVVDEKKIGYDIFGDDFTPDKFKSLKSDLVSKIIHRISVLEIAGSSLSDHSKAIYKGYLYLFYVRTLFLLGNPAGAMHFAGRLLRLAEKYELYYISVIMLDDLRKNAGQGKQRKKYDRYLAEYNKHLELLLSESHAEILEEQVFIQFSESLFVDDRTISFVAENLEAVETLILQNETYFSKLNYFRLKYIYEQVSGNPIESARACEEAITYMESKPHMTPRSRLAEFALYKLENCILACDYATGKETLMYCLTKINVGMMLWFKLKQYEFLLYMQTMKFAEAATVHREVTAHERFNSLPKTQRELWVLFGYHTEYVIRTDDQLKPRAKSYLSRRKDFRTHLLNFPTYEKDKSGYNIAILTLNILVTLEEGRFDMLLEHEDALSSYRFKYLNKKHCHQSFILFKLIRVMTKNDFDLAKIEKKSQGLQEELNAVKIHAGEIFENIQILPPDWVWKRIKEILRSRTVKKI
jgi:hypothetical protein